VFTWTPTLGQVGSHQVTLAVADNGVPVLGATQSFQVSVTAPSVPSFRIAGIARDPGNVSLQFAGPAGYTYVVESRPLSGGDWTKQGEVVAPPVNFPVLVRDPAVGSQKFYRVRNLTLPYQPPTLGAHFVSNGMFSLILSGQAGRSYVVETRGSLSLGNWSTLTNITLTPSNVPMSITLAASEASEFRATRFSLPTPTQRIDRIESTRTNVNLHFTLAPGLPATVETASTLAGASWLALTNLPAFSNQTSARVTDVIAAGPKFYRLNFSVPNSAVTITGQTATPAAMRIWFEATSNKTYTVQYRSLAGTGAWQTLTNLPAHATNGLRMVYDPAIAQPQRYYRLQTP
jgi:hypothetical protein